MYLYTIGCNNDLQLSEVVFPNDSLINYNAFISTPLRVVLDLFKGFAHFLFKCLHHLHKSEFKVIVLWVRCVAVVG